MTVVDNDTKITMLEEALTKLGHRVSMLEDRAQNTPVPTGKPTGVATDVLPDAMLENDWADKEVKRDPPKWTGTSYVGRKFSTCPVKYLKELAGFMEWKAAKGREETPVRVSEKTGKPWHESDAFEAKILRTWAARKSRKTEEPLPGLDGPSGGDSEVPF